MYGTVFRDARRSRGFSVRQLAAATKVSRRYLTLIDEDDANVSLKYLVRVAGALGIRDIRVKNFRVVLDGEDVTGLVLTEVADAIERLTAIQELLLSTPREAAAAQSLPSADSTLVADLMRAQNAHAPLAETPFTGRFVTAETLPRPHSQSLWSADWSTPTEFFVPVAYSYPEAEDARFLRARILDNSMAPELRAGDVVRIDTAIRAPRAGDLVAVHGMTSGSVIGALQSDDLAVLTRRNAPPLALWRERFVVQGTVAKVA
jgi:transcriptional regulator with XRE-family HTH domain